MPFGGVIYLREQAFPGWNKPLDVCRLSDLAPSDFI